MTCVDLMIFHPTDKTVDETFCAKRRNDLIPAPLNDQGWHVDLCDLHKRALAELATVSIGFDDTVTWRRAFWICGFSKSMYLNMRCNPRRTSLAAKSARFRGKGKKAKIIAGQRRLNHLSPKLQKGASGSRPSGHYSSAASTSRHHPRNSDQQDDRMLALRLLYRLLHCVQPNPRRAFVQFSMSAPKPGSISPCTVQPASFSSIPRGRISAGVPGNPWMSNAARSLACQRKDRWSLPSNGFGRIARDMWRSLRVLNLGRVRVTMKLFHEQRKLK